MSRAKMFLSSILSSSSVPPSVGPQSLWENGHYPSNLPLSSLTSFPPEGEGASISPLTLPIPHPPCPLQSSVIEGEWT